MAHEEAPGRYRAKIAVAADNAKTIYRTLDVAFTGKWSDNVDDMAATNFPGRINGHGPVVEPPRFFWPPVGPRWPFGSLS